MSATLQQFSESESVGLVRVMSDKHGILAIELSPLMLLAGALDQVIAALRLAVDQELAEQGEIVN